MIRIAFFDVGETLIHDGQPFPGVITALTAIAEFEWAEGRPLLIGIISDYHLPSPPATEEKIAALELQYRNQVLGPSGLSGFFEPFDSKVTLSTRAGVFKPARKVFDVALARSETGASLDECLFVTENIAHLEKCREFGITPLLFGNAGNDMPAFDDWADAPAEIARLVAPRNERNVAMATAAALAIRHGLVGFTVSETIGSSVRGHANRLLKLDEPRLESLNGVFVEVPSEVTVNLEPNGRIASVAAKAVGPEDMGDAVNFVSSLLKSGRIALPGQSPPTFGATHFVQQDAEGRARLLRRGYSSS